LIVLTSTALLNPQRGYEALANIWRRDVTSAFHPANSSARFIWKAA